MRVWPEAWGGRIGSLHWSRSVLLVRAQGRVSGSSGSLMLWARHKETPGQRSSVLSTPGTNKTSTKTAGDGYNTSLCKASLGPSTIPFLPPLVGAQMSLLSAASPTTPVISLQNFHEVQK